MNQTTTKVNSEDKKIKIDWFNLKKNRPWHSLRRSVLIYLSQVCLQVQFMIAIVFLFLFLDSFSLEGLLHYIVLFRRSWPSTC